MLARGKLVFKHVVLTIWYLFDGVTLEAAVSIEPLRLDLIPLLREHLLLDGNFSV